MGYSVHKCEISLYPVQVNFTSGYLSVEPVWIPGSPSSKLCGMPVPSCQHVVLSADHRFAVGALGGLHGPTAVRDHIVVPIGTLVPVSTRQPDGVYDEFELVIHRKLCG